MKLHAQIMYGLLSAIENEDKEWAAIIGGVDSEMHAICRIAEDAGFLELKYQINMDSSTTCFARLTFRGHKVLYLANGLTKHDEDMRLFIECSK